MSLRVAVSDAGPIHYLAIIGQVEILPRLFSRIVIPSQVAAELSRPTTPAVVRNFIATPPAWLEVANEVAELTIAGLHSGEAAALAFAFQNKTELLVDDQAARNAARRLGLRPIGTISILLRADEARLLDLNKAIEDLRATNFYISPEVLNQALQQRARKR